jgi:hypothetical protein
MFTRRLCWGDGLSPMSGAKDIELLFAVWEQNIETVRALNRRLRQDSLPRSGIAPQLVAHLKKLCCRPY